MIQENIEVLWNTKVGPFYYRMGLKCLHGFSDAVPGQFVMMRLCDQETPLLRRPFSIHRLIKKDTGIEGFEILYKVVGEGTANFSRLNPGEFVDLIGPLGRGFSVSDTDRSIYIVAGGIGVAPIVFLAKYLQEKGMDISDCSVFLGGRSEQDLLCKEDFLDLHLPVHVTTDDGSAGEKCLVTEPLETAIMKKQPDRMYACGPEAMLKCVAGLAEKYAVPCQVSIETIMACGMGACMGCAVEIQESPGRYQHACMDGPVFDVHVLKI